MKTSYNPYCFEKYYLKHTSQKQPVIAIAKDVIRFNKFCDEQLFNKYCCELFLDPIHGILALHPWHLQLPGAPKLCRYHPGDSYDLYCRRFIREKLGDFLNFNNQDIHYFLAQWDERRKFFIIELNK